MPPALPAPTGNVVRVTTEQGLQNALTALTNGTTIVIAPGTYALTRQLTVRGPLPDVTVRGETNNRATMSCCRARAWRTRTTAASSSASGSAATCGA